MQLSQGEVRAAKAIEALVARRPICSMFGRKKCNRTWRCFDVGVEGEGGIQDNLHFSGLSVWTLVLWILGHDAGVPLRNC